MVEDNLVSMMYAKQLLKSHGTKTYEAKDGIEAIKKVINYKSIDLVLLDLEIPRMNGFKAIKHIRSLRPNLIVIAFTANMPSLEIIKELDALGFNDILSKPFTKHDFYDILKKNMKKTPLN